jgi:hypothetical protein
MVLKKKLVNGKWLLTFMAEILVNLGKNWLIYSIFYQPFCFWQ